MDHKRRIEKIKKDLVGGTSKNGKGLLVLFADPLTGNVPNPETGEPMTPDQIADLEKRVKLLIVRFTPQPGQTNCQEAI